MNIFKYVKRAFTPVDTKKLDETLIQYGSACDRLKSSAKRLKDKAKAAQSAGQTAEESCIMQGVIKRGQSGERVPTDMKLKPIRGGA